MKERKYINNLIIRTIISLILFFLMYYLLNNENIYKIVFDNTIDFTYIRSKVNKLLGNITNKDYFVVSEKLEYQSVSKYHNSYKFITGYNYVISSLKTGVVTYIGNKDDLGSTVIVTSDDGYDYYYSNLENINVKVYDYIENNTILGSTKGNYFYLTISKDNEYFNYEDFI